MSKFVKVLYKLFFVNFPTLWYCWVSGVNYQKTMQLRGGG